MTENHNANHKHNAPQTAPPRFAPESVQRLGLGRQILQKPQPQLEKKRGLKEFFMPIIMGIMVFIAKLKFLVIPILQYGAIILKTGGTMIITVAAYAMLWGWWFALGFVMLIFVHECGHLVAARMLGLKVGAPVFIPFMGAIIALKEAPKNAWIEAQVGIGGPLLGTVGALACAGIYWLTGNELFQALAYTGFFLNLFNLIPVGFLDGGRVVTAISPWLWLLGFTSIVILMFYRFNFILMLIMILSAPRVWSLFRKHSAEEIRYFEVTTQQRWIITLMYFGLIGLLVIGMHLSMVQL